MPGGAVAGDEVWGFCGSRSAVVPRHRVCAVQSGSWGSFLDTCLQVSRWTVAWPLLQMGLLPGVAEAWVPSCTQPCPCTGWEAAQVGVCRDSQAHAGHVDHRAGGAVGSQPRVLQVTVTSLCPEGPVQAVEIQVESPSLANMCQAHHAIIERMQVCQSILGRLQKPLGWGPGTVVVCGCLRRVARQSRASSLLPCARCVGKLWTVGGAGQLCYLVLG